MLSSLDFLLAKSVANVSSSLLAVVSDLGVRGALGLVAKPS